MLLACVIPSSIASEIGHKVIATSRHDYLLAVLSCCSHKEKNRSSIEPRRDTLWGGGFELLDAVRCSLWPRKLCSMNLV